MEQIRGKSLEVLDSVSNENCSEQSPMSSSAHAGCRSVWNSAEMPQINVEANQRLSHIFGGGIRAARALQLRALAHGHYIPQWSTVFPYPLVELVCEYLTLKSLPAFRGTCHRFQHGLLQLLERAPTLARALADHVNMRDIQAKRVWVAVRMKPTDELLGNVSMHHNRVKVAGETFFFDSALGGSAAQNEVWSCVRRQLMSAVMERKHVCFMAYGQTGSGKTHTMFGDRDVPGGEGIAFRAVHSLRRMIFGSEVQGKGIAPVVQFSFLEVYNEKVYDLLGNHKQCELVVRSENYNPGGKYHRGSTSGKEHVVAKNSTRKTCDLECLEEQIGEWLYEGACTRTVGKTVFNERSSRSHAVATLHITWAEGGCETRLYLVDLAGSERAGQYALSAEQLKQGVNINKSLSTMARVISTMASGAAEHIPYRDSALTWLLSDSITGHNARAFMVAAINPSHLPETLSTLRYAQQYSSLQSNQEEINKLGSHLRKALAQLQAQRSHFKHIIQQAGWTRATLAARKALNQHETHQTRHLFGLLRDLEDAEERHAKQREELEHIIEKNKLKEDKLLIKAD
jgi:hypothetical protein